MTGQVEGKVALVTGGASGIGAAVAELLAREGASVAVTDIDDLKGPEIVAGIKKAGHEAMFLHQDVTSEAALGGGGGRGREALRPARHPGFQCRHRDIGAVDRRDVAGRLAAADRDQSRRRVPVGEALPAAMRRSGGGSIIMMSSLAGLRGAPTLAGYCATKGGVRLFAKAIAMECASFGDGIRVNSVHPGIIDTPIWGKIPTEATGQRTETRRSIRKNARNWPTPLGRAGHADGDRGGCLYLASDASSYVTGTELVIDGGMNAGGAVRQA